MASIQDNNTILIYRVGPVLCCSPCMSVLSITHPVPLTKLPGQQSHHSGIFKFGSSLVNVCELRHNFGVNPTEWRDPGRIIITELSTGHVGFWVDEILDVMESPATGWGNPPPLIPKATFSRTLTLKNEIHLYVEFDNLYAIKQVGYLKSYIEQLQKLNSSSDKIDTTPANQSLSNTENLTTSASSNSGNSNTTVLLNESNNNVITKDSKNNLNEKIKPKSEKLDVPENQNTIKQDLNKNSNNNIKKNWKQTEINKNASNTKSDLKLKNSDRKHSTVKKTSQATTAAKKSTVFQSSAKSNNFNPTQSNTNYIDNTENSDYFSSLLLIGLALLLILLAGSYFYLQPDSGPDFKAYSLNTEPENTIVQNDNNRNITNTKKIEESSDEQSNTVLADKSDSSYSANIKNDSDGITITVHTPVTTEQFESLKEKTNTVEKTTEIEKIKNKITEETDHEPDTTPKEILKEKPNDFKITIQVSKDQRSKKIAPSTITKEIIHIVVKGDTLWHIAKFYVDDPYRYPELARLSNIKNPDLIYPGNRVHIIQIFSDGQFLDDK